MKITKEQALAWRAAYESGESLHGLSSQEAARGRKTSGEKIKGAILSVGGTLRSMQEAIILLGQRKKNKNAAAKKELETQ